MTDWNRHFTNCLKYSVNSRLACLHKFTLTYTCMEYVMEQPGHVWICFHVCNILFVFKWCHLLIHINKFAISEYRKHFPMLKWWHLINRISIIDTSIYVFKFLLNKLRVSEYGIYCSMWKWWHLITRLDLPNYIYFKFNIIVL